MNLKELIALISNLFLGIIIAITIFRIISVLIDGIIDLINYIKYKINKKEKENENNIR
jgi:hypothetical protein